AVSDSLVIITSTTLFRGNPGMSVRWADRVQMACPKKERGNEGQKIRFMAALAMTARPTLAQPQNIGGGHKRYV
ncbi:hypothetical protein, partial [Paraburkholderia hospita]|uniref:hypothetical protein n=1 Tax=Paraburkholderia hospita TaxID=169430 RepID=UPI001F624E2F